MEPDMEAPRKKVRLDNRHCDVEEKLKQQEAMLIDRKAKMLEAMKTISSKNEVAIKQLQMTMKELRKAVDDKEQMSTVTEQSIPPLLSIADPIFSLAHSVAVVKQKMNDVIILPILDKQVEAGEYIQGRVVSKLNRQGLFWLRIVRRESEGALMVISQSIRADLQCDVIKPVTKATVGELYCAYFLEDKQWYRAKVVSIVSATHVKICFVDYEEYPVTDLRSLPRKYLIYPFQTIRCCLTNDDGVELSREACWLFNDRTKNKIVYSHIISELPGSSTDDKDIHYLVTVKEPGEGGADISSTVFSKVKEKQRQPKHRIIHQQKLTAATPLPAEAPPIRPKVDVIDSYDNDVAPPPNEALVAGSTTGNRCQQFGPVLSMVYSHLLQSNRH